MAPKKGENGAEDDEEVSVIDQAIAQLWAFVKIKKKDDGTQIESKTTIGPEKIYFGASVFG